LIKQYEIVLMDEVTFTITDEALDFIVDKSLRINLELTRGLCTNHLTDAM
jgi:ATP-dependent Clp protease ATP-binding subunit ClpX